MKERADRGFFQVQRQPLRVAYHDDSTPSESESTNAQPDAAPKSRILAGLAGHTVGSYFHTSLLWVSEELRGKRVGQALLATAELEARRRGCTASILDTFDFQAEGFYRKQGYTPFARLPGGFANRSTRIYVIKFLAPMRCGHIALCILTTVLTLISQLRYTGEYRPRALPPDQATRLTRSRRHTRTRTHGAYRQESPRRRRL